jgi:hypothetical protein
MSGSDSGSSHGAPGEAGATYSMGAATALAAGVLVGGRLLAAMKRSIRWGDRLRQLVAAAVIVGAATIWLGFDTSLRGLAACRGDRSPHRRGLCSNSAECGAPHSAEFERELIVERTKAGLASARARGRNGGRPFKMTIAKLRLAQAAMGQPGSNVGELCIELGVSRQTLYRHMDPTGRLRPDGEKLLGRKRKGPVPTAARVRLPA